MLILALAMAATAAADMSATAVPVVPACHARQAKRGLLGGLAKGLANAAPLLGGRDGALQVVTGIAGQAITAAEQAVPRPDCTDPAA